MSILKKDNKDIDNAIDSLLSIEKNEDVHIWIDYPGGKTRIRIITTEKGCVTMDFFDAPELVGYCRYKGHICYIYMWMPKQRYKTIFFNLCLCGRNLSHRMTVYIVQKSDWSVMLQKECSIMKQCAIKFQPLRMTHPQQRPPPIVPYVALS